MKCACWLWALLKNQANYGQELKFVPKLANTKLSICLYLMATEIGIHLKFYHLNIVELGNLTILGIGKIHEILDIFVSLKVCYPTVVIWQNYYYRFTQIPLLCGSFANSDILMLNVYLLSYYIALCSMLLSPYYAQIMLAY